ncbi:hypothetical protein Ssi02_35410 [Sinosporangium siamense]|uniref:Uncharacterized protein n=1 Tax=Sinosporangium siamense TaxID=1367973 RepID=A0A919RG77_9ACTN|nr:hypothetical protein Ssi02_35410 [Sinosporangium siamense]
MVWAGQDREAPRKTERPPAGLPGVVCGKGVKGAGQPGTRATQKTVWPNGGRTKRSMRRVAGTTVRS